MKYQDFLIALGSNLPSAAGRSDQTLRAALENLADLGAETRAISRFYKTPCFPIGAGRDYVNAAARIAFCGTPRDLLDVLHRVEEKFGRERVQRWGQRTLDLDLIAAGDTILPDRETHAQWRGLPIDRQASQSPDQLILPHPRMQDRAFVLIPLKDVSAGWVHPFFDCSVEELISRLPQADVNAVVAL